MKLTSDEAYAAYQERKRINPEYRAKRIAQTAKWKEQNKEKRVAHKAVEKAINSGLLIKPTRCQVCNVEPKRLDGHHEDYTKLLEVQWLCRSCHILAHNPDKKPARWGRTPRAASPQEE